MWLWLPVIVGETTGVYCDECDKELTENTKAFVKVWWQYKSELEYQLLICEECMRRRRINEAD